MVGTAAWVQGDYGLAARRLIASVRRRSLYPSLYPWLIVLAVLDIVLTAIILGLGGTEANAVARAVIESSGLTGMILLKVVSIGFTVAVCQYVGRRRFRAGHVLAQIAVAANTAAVSVGCAAIVVYTAAVIGG